MKRAISLFLVLALTLGIASAAFAAPKDLDGLSDRKITIHPAGLNEEPEALIAQGISPTTGRQLAGIEIREGALGVAVTGIYQPIMVQISNSNNGVGTYPGTGAKSGEPYRFAPVNGGCADVVYEALQKRGGSETRMSMIFSDVIPDYAGFVRSTRLTHCRIRQEWECAFCTSGYTPKDVPKEWNDLGVPNPAGKRTVDDPGIAYVGDLKATKPWGPYVFRMYPYQSPNNEVFNLTGLLNNIIPKDHKAANHTWKFTDDLPSGGDSGEVVYVTFGGKETTNSRLEYNPDTNGYIRYVAYGKQGDLPYCENVLTGAEVKKVKDTKGTMAERLTVEGMDVGDPIIFNNVIIQSIVMKWKGFSRPDPQLVGTGNADYFMGGVHLSGVWNRDDVNSRTVFYGPDGNEIELQRGRTLIILMDYSDKKTSVQYE